MLTLTALYGAACTALLVGLAVRVSLARLRRAENDVVRLVARVHANAAENVPIFLILFAVAELNGAAAWALHGLGVGFLVARVLHAVGLSRSAGRSVPRFVGISLNWTLIAALAAYGAWLALTPAAGA